MKNKNVDIVMNEVRQARAEVAREREKNPAKFHAEIRQIMKEHGMKPSRIKPIKILRLKPSRKLADVA